MTESTISVLVTGAAGGVGRALVEHFKKQGCKVFATDLTALEVDYPADIRRSAACKAVVAAAVAAMGRLDVLINAAGVWREGPVEECSEEDFDLVLDVNLKGTFFMCAAAIPYLKESEGSIVNISSDAGRQGNKNAAAYCASKGGVTLLSKTLALDLAPFGVRCNAISPAISRPRCSGFRPSNTARAIHKAITGPCWTSTRRARVRVLFRRRKSPNWRFS